MKHISIERKWDISLGISMDRFYKCDLHMHSPSCYSRSLNKADFLKKIEESDIEVFSLTDHNVIDLDLYKHLLNNSKKKFILGIEMNISINSDIISNHKLEISDVGYFHAILWFDITEIDAIVEKLEELQKEQIDASFFSGKRNYKAISKALEGKSFDIEEIQRKYTNNAYFFVPHEGKGHRDLTKYLPNNSVNNQDFKSKMFYFNNRYGIEGDKNEKVLNFHDSSLKTAIANFHFSDAMTVDEIGSKFSWINFNGDFSSLILPFSDPKKRVFNSSECELHPQKNRKNYLEKVRFDIGEDSYELKFSPGINGIIGARGSGKSLLASILTNDISRYSALSIGHIEFKLVDSSYSKATPKYQYISQGYLSKIFDERDFRKIGFINNIKDNLVNQKMNAVEGEINSVKNVFKEIETELKSFVEEYISEYSFSDISEYKVDSSLVQSVGDLEDVNDEDERNSTLLKLKQLKTDLNKYLESANGLENNYVFKETDILKNSVSEFNKLNTEKVTEILLKLELLIKEHEDNDLIFKILIRNQNMASLKKTIADMNGEINNSVRILGERYSDFMSYLKSLNQLRVNLKNKTSQAMATYRNIFTHNEKDEFQLLDGEKIVITTTLEKHESFNELVFKYFKDKGTTVDESLISLVLDDYNEIYNKSKIRSVRNLSDLFEKLISKIISDVQKHEKIEIDILVDGVNIEQLSPGKQSEILLRIILEKEINGENDLKFIVFDQPEDNLDTQTIVKFLVDKLRELKLERQIFIVSHSAPLIVNSDSDLVISCTNKNKITYTTGNINDKRIRSSIVDVLDGGEKYLKMRVNKYDFNFKEE